MCKMREQREKGMRKRENRARKREKRDTERNEKKDFDSVFSSSFLYVRMYII